MQIPVIVEQILTKSPLLCGIWGFEANGDFLFALTSFSFSGGYSNSHHYNKSRATIIKKNKYFLLEASEEAVATILFVLSTPNAMPLLTQRHRPNHGALLFRLTAKKKGLTNRN
jgi:hypothetical protein